MTTVLCPVCSAASSLAFEKDGFEILDCANCDHRFTTPNLADNRLTHVNTVYGDDYFYGGGAGYSNYLDQETLLCERGKSYARILGKHTQPGRILDVGAAAGFILKGFIDSGWTGNGIEPNDSMASVARSQLGLEVWTGMMENLAGDLSFDAVSMIQVLPHFIDPKHAMGVVEKILRPGGLLLIETWNYRSWTAQILKQSWHEYSPPSVLHWFSPQSVIRLAGQFGLHPVDQGRPTKKILTSHAKSLLKHKFAGSPGGRLGLRMLDLFPDRWAMPYPAEDLFYMVLKKGT